MFFRDRVPAPKPILVQMLYRFGQKFRNFQLCQQFRRILFPKHKTSRPELLLVDHIGGGMAFRISENLGNKGSEYIFGYLMVFF